VPGPGGVLVAPSPSGVGWGGDGPCPGAGRESRGRAACRSARSVSAVPKRREGVAAEVTLQEHPFPPYLPSGARYVADIKADDLLRSLPVGLILSFTLEKMKSEYGSTLMKSEC